MSRTRLAAVRRVRGNAVDLAESATIIPTSIASPPAMSTTGIGFKATAAPVAMAEVPDQAVGRVIADANLALDDLGVQIAGDQESVQGDESFSLALEDVKDPNFQRLDQRRGTFPLDLARAVGELNLDLVGLGPGRGHDDVVGTDQVLDALVLDLGVDLVAVDFGIAVDLIEDDDDRLLGVAQLGQGFDLGALHVAGDDEEEQIAVAGDVAREGLADLAADLVDSRRIDDDEPGAFEAGMAGDVVMPSLGGALHRRAVSCADREDILAHEGIQIPTTCPGSPFRRRRSRSSIPRASCSRSRNCDSSPAKCDLFLGRQLQAGERRFEARFGALDRFVFVSDLTFKLAQQFLELGIGHGMSLSLTEGSDRVFAPLGDLEQLEIATGIGDELDRHGQAVRPTERSGNETVGKRKIAPGRIECRIAGGGGVWGGGDGRGCDEGAQSSTRCVAFE